MNENYFEEKYDDMDEDIKKKEALVAEAESIQEFDNAQEANRHINQLPGPLLGK